MGYDGFCRDLSDEQLAAFAGRGPQAGACGSGCPTARSPSTTWSAARSPSRPSSSPTTRSCRANGDPLYTLVTPVDDALMEITHVLRGEDLLSSTPRQIALYDALAEIGVGTGTPRAFGHLPYVMGEGNKKLSKRDPEADLLGYRDAGLPARGAAQLPRAARLGDRGGPRHLHPGGDGRGVRHRATSTPTPPASTSRRPRRSTPRTCGCSSLDDLTDRVLPFLQGRRGRRRPGQPIPTRSCSSWRCRWSRERMNKLTEAVDMLGFLFVDEAVHSSTRRRGEAARRRRPRGRPGGARRAGGAGAVVDRGDRGGPARRRWSRSSGSSPAWPSARCGSRSPGAGLPAAVRVAGAAGSRPRARRLRAPGCVTARAVPELGYHLLHRGGRRAAWRPVLGRPPGRAG